jgi:hypothetical protein
MLARLQNLEFETVMKSIHAILPDGTVISGVEVFRRLYESVGLGFVYESSILIVILSPSSFNFILVDCQCIACEQYSRKRNWGSINARAAIEALFR